MRMTYLSNTTFDADKILLQPLAYLSQNGPEPRNVNARVWRAFNFWYDCPKDKRQIVAGILDDVLSTCYLMDDVIDEAVLRRGLPVAHFVFGLAHTIYGTVYASMNILERFLFFDEHKATVVDSYIDLVIRSQRSECLTLYIRDNLICPTYEEYTEIFGYTFWIPFTLQVLRLYGRNKLPNVSPVLQDRIGNFIVMYNDYINLQSKKYFKLRVPCDDVTEGKFSYMVIHAIRSHQEDDRIIKLLKERPNDAESKNRFVKILEELGSFEFTKNTMKRFRDEAFKEAEKLYMKRNPYFEKPFDDILRNLETDEEVYFDVCGPKPE